MLLYYTFFLETSKFAFEIVITLPVHLLSVAFEEKFTPHIYLSFLKFKNTHY